MTTKIPDYLDYINAIGNPTITLADPYLKEGMAPNKKTRGGRTQYETYSGQFALTIRFAVQTDEWAIRCFTHELQPDFEERYRHVTHFIQQANTDFLVDIEFQRQGILVNGTWYAICKMEWVKGETLSKYIENNLKQPRRLATLPDNFLELALEIEELNFAHGDLQHGNIMVESRQLRLVDYDGMYLPSYDGKYMQATEVGHRNYQHPRRTAKDFNNRIDRFSTISIYLSLRALQKDINLYPTEGESLFLKQSDYTDPDHSPNIAKLAELGYEDAAKRFREICKGPIDAVPTLRHFIREDAVLLSELSEVLQREVKSEPEIRVVTAPPPAPIVTSTQPVKPTPSTSTAASAAKPTPSTPVAKTDPPKTTSKPVNSSPTATFKPLDSDDVFIMNEPSKSTSNPAPRSTTPPPSTPPSNLNIPSLGPAQVPTPAPVTPATQSPGTFTSTATQPPTSSPVAPKTAATTISGGEPTLTRGFLFKSFLFALVGFLFARVGFEVAFSDLDDVVSQAFRWLSQVNYYPALMVAGAILAVGHLILQRVISADTFIKRVMFSIVAFLVFNTLYASFVYTSGDIRRFQIRLTGSLFIVVVSLVPVFGAFFFAKRKRLRMFIYAFGLVAVEFLISFISRDSSISAFVIPLFVGIGIGFIPAIPGSRAQQITSTNTSKQTSGPGCAYRLGRMLRAGVGLLLMGGVVGGGIMAFNAFGSQAPRIDFVNGSGSCTNFRWLVEASDPNNDLSYVSVNGSSNFDFDGDESAFRYSTTCNNTRGTCTADLIAFDSRGNRSSVYRATETCTIETPAVAPQITNITSSGTCADVAFTISYVGNIRTVERLDNNNAVQDTVSVSSGSTSYTWQNLNCASGNCNAYFRVIDASGQRSSVQSENFRCTPQQTRATSTPTAVPPRIDGITSSGTCSNFDFIITYRGDVRSIEWLNASGNVRDTRTVGAGTTSYRWEDFTCSSSSCSANFRAVSAGGQRSATQTGMITCTPESNERTGIVRSTDGTNINVRSGPGTSYRIVTQISSGTRVTIIDSRNGWNQVRINNTEGWINQSLFR